jgi:CelD/BcsL family acetyltransferase involved in cellulose biosynthesis
MLEIGLIRNTRELEAAAEAWRALWNEDPQATPFQSPEWLLPWWHVFGQSELRVAAIYGGGRLTGLAPFCLDTGSNPRERRLIALGAGTSDYLDGVFSPACPETSVQHALGIVTAAGPWDMLSVPQLQPHSFLLRAARQIERAEIFTAARCWQAAASRLDALPGKMRHNVGYYRNRAAAAGRLEFGLVPDSELQQALDQLASLSTARWQSRGEHGALADARVMAWHRAALPRLAESGLLRFYALKLDSETIAVLYSLLDPPGRVRRRLYVYLHAFSQEHRELAPGTVLQALAIDSAAAEGAEVVDWLRGDEQYKRLWHAQPVPTYGFTLRERAQTLRYTA